MRNRLTDLLEQGTLSAREQAEAGDLLGELGDPRFDPDLYFLPGRYRGEPEPLAGFVEIPPGPFVMGEDHKKQNLIIDYHPYWMTSYPVTVAQFGAFVEAGGYQRQDWWTPTGWDWRQGRWDSTVEEDWLRDWLKRRPPELRCQPMWWYEQRAVGNQPVMGISWFEAVAYCRWLHQALCRAGGLSPLQDERYALRLSTEAEWEKAARSSQARPYPWGDEDWDAERANISASEIGHPTLVGMYSRGATGKSSEALHDLAGNVWEWTRSKWEMSNIYRTDFGYPYDPADGRESSEGLNLRGL